MIFDSNNTAICNATGDVYELEDGKVRRIK
jgi:hypothetical protein